MNWSSIHIGNFIKERSEEFKIDMLRICNFMKCSEEEIEKMYQSESLEIEIVLRWSKLLEYDFFRLYSHHLVLYSPPKSDGDKGVFIKTSSKLPCFRKNLYTKEIIDFILGQINNGNKTKRQVIEEYHIPKTTLYKWIQKHQSNE